MSASPNVDNAAGPRTRDEEPCRQVDKIQPGQGRPVSECERRVRREAAVPTTVPTFAVAKDGAPSPVLLDYDALRLVCAHVPKDHRLPMRLTCRALRDACPEASLEDKRTLCYRELRRSDAAIRTITRMSALCTSVSLFRWAIDPQGGGVALDRKKRVGRAVAAAGSVDVMRFLVEGCPWFSLARDWDPRTCETAALHNHPEMLKFLRTLRVVGTQARQCPWTVSTLSAAAEAGNLDMVQWVHANGLRPNPHAVAMACRGGNDRMLTWMLDHADAPVDEYASFWAALNGHLRCLEALWLHSHPMDDRCCYAAAGAGHLECLQWLRKGQKGHWDHQTCNHAAGGNQVECLRWALENGAACLHEASRAAVARGHVDCAQVLVEFGRFRPSDWECCTLAAEMGHLEMLRWLRFHGGQWHASLVYQMVCVAHPGDRGATRECVHWARANGYDATVPGVEARHLVLLDEMYTEDHDVGTVELGALRDEFRAIYGQTWLNWSN